MARVVFCRKLKRDADGLDEPPLHGRIGKEVFENTSKEAWDEWVEMQVKVVNEYHLDLSEKSARKTLMTQLRAFLCLDDEAPGEVMEVGTPTAEFHDAEVPDKGG